MMFRSLLENNTITIPEKDVQFILALIDGEPSQCRYSVSERTSNAI
jgi:hypothetical protein